jgi:hypothetical protein
MNTSIELVWPSDGCKAGGVTETGGGAMITWVATNRSAITRTTTSASQLQTGFLFLDFTFTKKDFLKKSGDKQGTCALHAGLQRLGGGGKKKNFA